MYPGTKFNWYDNSWFSSTTAENQLSNPPLFLTAFSADKGTESLIRLRGASNFNAMFGQTQSFDKHGQVLLQAKRIVDAGGEILCKRVVANDATLSNLILTAVVSTHTEQSTDEEGHPLYIDNVTGEETTDAETNGVENNPVNVVTTKIKWVKNTVENCKTFREVMDGVVDINTTPPVPEEGATDVVEGIYPLLVATDIGRNADIKKLRIVPDYQTSKSLGVMVYAFSEVEGSTVYENVTVTANPNVVINNTSYAINQYTMGQLTIDYVPGMLDAYVGKLAELTGMNVADIMNLDFIFGRTLKGAAIDGVALDAEGIDLASDFGIKLVSGSDGTAFGTTAYHTSTAYEDALISFFSGEDTDAIYDVDVHKIAACCDANFSVKVKEAITALAMFREDFFFFRDLGLGLSTFNSIVSAQSLLTHTRFASDYMSSYQVIDPQTKRRIPVTCMYDLAPVLVNHLAVSPHLPYAGEANNFVLTSAIEGTLNYTPVNTPSVNQKDLLDEAHINYATYYEYGGNLVVSSLYTAQEGDSQLSYLNNVIAIQEVMRALRSACPKNRFKFQTGNDFAEYEEACRAVLRNFREWFYLLDFNYTQDDLRASQKIFYASINFAFNNWTQSEIFDLYAIPTTSLSAS